jgi:hypothetical protein
MLLRRDFPLSEDPLMWPSREFRKTYSRKSGSLAKRKAGIEKLILWIADYLPT